MLFYTYDGSFEGLLTAIYEAVYRREEPFDIVSWQFYQQSMLDESLSVTTDFEKSDKVYDSIKRKISLDALENAYYSFLSEDEKAGIRIYRYLRLGWKLGRDVDHFLSDDSVLWVHNTRRRVYGEMHRMLGLIRFREIKGSIYYAPIEPDSNIAAMLAPHFSCRLADQNWIIHDMKRSIGIVYNCREWAVIEMKLDTELPLAERELGIQDLWRSFFSSIAIKSRRSATLQRQHMPARYWRHLTEMQPAAKQKYK